MFTSLLEYISRNNIVADTLGENKIKDTEINKDELFSLLKTDYSQSYLRAKKGYFIFRGDFTPNDLGIRKPGIRTSLNNGYNYYNRLLSDILYRWRAYPKRNRSFICSSAYAYAANWSDVINVVFPKNDTRIAICPEYDMWKSFSEYAQIDRMLNLNIDLCLLFSYVTGYTRDESNNLFKNDSVLAIRKYLFKVDKAISDMSVNDYETLLTNINTEFYNKGLFTNIVNKVKYNDSSLIQMLDYILDPSKNGFRLINIEDYSFRINEYHEIWFDNDAIFLNLEYIWNNKADPMFAAILESNIDGEEE